MAKNKKKLAKKTSVKAKSAVKKPVAKKIVKKIVKKSAPKKETKKSAARKIVAKTTKKRSGAAPKGVVKKAAVTKAAVASSVPAASAPVRKFVPSFVEEAPKAGLLLRPLKSSMPKDTDLEDELLDDMDMAGEADEIDEDVEEELTLDGEDGDSDFLEKPESLLGDGEDYHTH